MRLEKALRKPDNSHHLEFQSCYHLICHMQFPIGGLLELPQLFSRSCNPLYIVVVGN